MSYHLNVVHSFPLLCCSVTKSCLTLCNPMDCSTSLSFTISQSLLKLTSSESMMPSNHLILCCPLLLPSIFPSIRVFSTEPALCIRWPKYWSFHCFGVFHYTAVSQFILALMDNKFQFGAVISNAVKNFLSVYFVTQIFAFLGYMLDRHLRVELTAQTMHTFRHCHV